MSRPFRRNACAVRGLARGQAAAVAARPGTRMGDGRIRDAAARDADPNQAQIGGRQSFRPQPGNSAPDRPIAASGRGSAAARRATDHHRLRRAAGGRGHPHRLDHRRMDRAARLPALDGAALHPAREPAQGSCRRRILRHCRRRSGDRSRLCRGLERPHRREFRHDRLGRPGRSSGVGGRRAIHGGRAHPDAGRWRAAASGSSSPCRRRRSRLAPEIERVRAR